MTGQVAACQIQETVQALLKEKPRVLVALEGRCASGKSTLAEILSREFGWAVAHMDDFFLRPEQRTPQRLAKPGGNVDWERVLEEVLLPWQGGGQVAYRPYDCQSGKEGDLVQLDPAARVLVVEGSYSVHPGLWKYYDLRVFLDVDERRQMARISRREGKSRSRIFRDRWIPLEEAYLTALPIAQRCQRRFSLEG